MCLIRSRTFGKEWNIIHLDYGISLSLSSHPGIRLIKMLMRLKKYYQYKDAEKTAWYFIYCKSPSKFEKLYT